MVREIKQSKIKVLIFKLETGTLFSGGQKVTAVKTVSNWESVEVAYI